MIVTRVGKDLLRLLRQHAPVASLAFAVVAGGCGMAGMRWPKYYSGSALIAWNQRSTLSAAPGGETKQKFPQADLSAQLQQVSAHIDWAGIAARYRPAQSAGGVSQGGAELASQVLIEQVTAPDLGGTAVRIAYTANDRESVLDILNAVAIGFARPLPETLAAAQAAKAQSEEPLYAPVVLPTEPVAPPAPKAPARSVRSRMKNASRYSLRRESKQGQRAAPKRRRESVESMLTGQLATSLSEGKRLREASLQNSSTLAGLQAETEKQRSAIAQLPSPAPAPQPTIHKANPQEEQLRQDFVRVQTELADLQARYTDQYPDVVTAREKLRDLQIDLDRIAASGSTLAKAKSEKQPDPTDFRVAAPNFTVVNAQIQAAEAEQSRLQQALARNQNDTALLRIKLAAAGIPDTSVIADSASGTSALETANASAAAIPTPATTGVVVAPSGRQGNPEGASDAVSPVTQTITDSLLSPFFLVRQPAVETKPFFLATEFLWPLSLAFGLLAALLAAWLTERLDPSIRNERMLRRELPASAVYLGGIPRIRHEVIAD